MENKTQTIEKTTSNEVEVGTSFTFNAEPTAPNMVLDGLTRAVDHVKLETRMLVFDALHGTHYRSIRHEIVEQEKRRKFEESIGLIVMGKK